MGHKLDIFMKHGPYVDYPFESVMFRWDAEHKYMFKKHYGSADETIVGWSSGLLNEMLAHGGAEPLTEAEYNQGKERRHTILTANGRRQRRRMFAFDQALYLRTGLSCEAYADLVGLEIQFRSKAPVVDWLTSATTPETSVQTSAPTGIHPAAEGHVDPDLELFWDERDEQIIDPATYELQIGFLVKSIKSPEVSGGLYIANSARAVWWNEADGVTITTDPDTLASIPGQLLAPALVAAGIAYGEAAPSTTQ